MSIYLRKFLDTNPTKIITKTENQFHVMMVFKNTSQEWCHVSINLAFKRQKNKGPRFQLNVLLSIVNHLLSVKKITILIPSSVGMQSKY